MGTVRLTMAQALVRFLANQYVERDGIEQRFFADGSSSSPTASALSPARS